MTPQSPCAPLAVVLDYLYAGYPALAWSELARLYPCPDVSAFAAEINATVLASPRFTP